MKTVGIVGLGLIGGSFAKAYHEAGWRVFGFDPNKTILGFTILDGVTNAELTPENMKECDLVLLAAGVG